MNTEIPVISIVGYSGSGKTTLIEKLLPALSARGLRVAVIKHDAHEFEIDKPGKDSWRFSAAGAAVSVIASATHCAVMENRPLQLHELIGRVRAVDLILTEGFKTGNFPKIAVYRAASGKPLPETDGSYIAVAADSPVKTSLPLFSLVDISALADFIYGKTRF